MKGTYQDYVRIYARCTICLRLCTHIDEVELTLSFRPPSPCQYPAILMPSKMGIRAPDPVEQVGSPNASGHCPFPHPPIHLGEKPPHDRVQSPHFLLPVIDARMASFVFAPVLTTTVKCSVRDDGPDRFKDGRCVEWHASITRQVRARKSACP